MEIKTFIGRKLNYVNGILRRQIEIDRPLKEKSNLKLTYEYYTKPKNALDFISKRYMLYPFYSKRRAKDKNIVNHLSFQYLGDLGHFLDKSRTLITCHDIFTFLIRNDFKNPYFIQKYSSSGLKKCRYIISISEFTKNELVQKLKISEEKVIVIKNGMNQKMFYRMAENDIDNIPPLFPEFTKILHVGNEEYRKNFITLLKALYLLKKKIKNIKLIRIGPCSHQRILKLLNLEKDIIYLNNISNDRLREIYNLSDLFVYPSNYEGWGAPGLEAAACETPVVCSDIPIFREVYHDYPYYFPPNNYKVLTDAIYQCLMDESLRNEMKKKGLNVVKTYSWKKSAEKYLKLAKYVLEQQ
jgi:glycosyltransferase involved in cell wall biosynthesis